MKNIKKITALVLCLCLAASLSACKGGGNNPEGMDFDPTDPSIYTIDIVTAMGEGKSLNLDEERKEPAEVKKAADDLLKQIEEYPDDLQPKEGGKFIYVSNDGNDDKDGLSPETAVATIQKGVSLAKTGDVVVLNRGDFWREHPVLKAGVSLGAYGKGNKPTIYGSMDGTKLEWVKEEDENIWSVDVGTSADVGNIVFDHGKAFANKKNKMEEVIRDLNFYYKPRGTTVYLYSEKDPRERFETIEICYYGSIITQETDSTVQNLRIMYTGSHGITIPSKTKNTYIKGCVIGYIGGSYMSGLVRYGNGIQIWGDCDGHYIEYCHVYQCFDAGITPQFLKDNGVADITEKNIKYSNNLLEYSVYNIEYFLHNTTGEFSNVEFSKNVVRYGGYGWGTLSRSGKNNGTNIQGGNSCKSENFVIKDNIFVHGAPKLLRVNNTNGSAMPTFSGNTYIINKNRDLYVTQKGTISAKDSEGKTAADIFGDATGKLIIY